MKLFLKCRLLFNIFYCLCVCKQAFHISGHNSKSKCYYNTKLSAYYIYVLKKVSVDFQIYIIVSLKKILRKLLSPSLWQTQSMNFTRIIEGPRALFWEKYKGSLTLKLLWNFSLSPAFFYTGWYISFHFIFYTATDIAHKIYYQWREWVRKLCSKTLRQTWKTVRSLQKIYCCCSFIVFIFCILGESILAI